MISLGLIATTLPLLNRITGPETARNVLIRPDGYVAWAGDVTHQGLPNALTSWFGPPTTAQLPLPPS